ncbi:SLBB domain-containing protein [bacterium]|nr:SLBB domain-containing protein [bacterium]
MPCFSTLALLALCAALSLTGPVPLAAQLSRSDILDQNAAQQAMEQRKQMLQNKVSTVQPGERVPLDGMVDRSAYCLGPGDEMDVSIWAGDEYYTYPLVVSAEGRLLVPMVGPVEVGGLSLENAEKLLGVQCARFFTGARVQLSLTNPRLFRAYVVGAVNKPGTYYHSAFDRVSDLVRAAEGIKSGGSRRRLHLFDRDHKPLTSADLLAFVATGNPAFNPRLVDGCILEVPQVEDYVLLRGRFINLVGADSIKINDISKDEMSEHRVEINPGETLGDLLALVGQPDVEGVGGKVRVRIVSKSGAERQADLDEAMLQTPLETGSTIEFPTQQFFVYVTGNVTRSGRYLYQSGFTALDYLGQAGGPSMYGSTTKFKVRRSDGRTVEVSATDRLYPGDMLYIPEKVRWLDRTLAPLISLVGVLIAVAAR